VKLKVAICGISLLLAGILSASFAAQARDRTNNLDRRAALVSRCIAEQTAAELSKGTTSGQFEVVLRDKCRAQEDRFKKILLVYLKKEGSFNPQAVRLADELLAALRQQAVTAYGDAMRAPGRLVNRQIHI
jgi:hypothetical protein